MNPRVAHDELVMDSACHRCLQQKGALGLTDEVFSNVISRESQKYYGLCEQTSICFFFVLENRLLRSF